MHACVHTHTHSLTHTHTFTHSAQTHVRKYTHMHTRTHTNTHMHTHNSLFCSETQQGGVSHRNCKVTDLVSFPSENIDTNTHAHVRAHRHTHSSPPPPTQHHHTIQPNLLSESISSQVNPVGNWMRLVYSECINRICLPQMSNCSNLWCIFMKLVFCSRLMSTRGTQTVPPDQPHIMSQLHPQTTLFSSYASSS